MIASQPRDGFFLLMSIIRLESEQNESDICNSFTLAANQYRDMKPNQERPCMYLVNTLYAHKLTIT